MMRMVFVDLKAITASAAFAGFDDSALVATGPAARCSG
jgi:hypothetical protein